LFAPWAEKKQIAPNFYLKQFPAALLWRRMQRDKELEANRAIFCPVCEGIQDKEQWAQNVQGAYEGFLKRDRCLNHKQGQVSRSRIIYTHRDIPPPLKKLRVAATPFPLHAIR
jgi:hypothetical protein